MQNNNVEYKKNIVDSIESIYHESSLFYMFNYKGKFFKIKTSSGLMYDFVMRADDFLYLLGSSKVLKEKLKSQYVSQIVLANVDTMVNDVEKYLETGYLPYKISNINEGIKNAKMISKIPRASSETLFEIIKFNPETYYRNGGKQYMFRGKDILASTKYLILISDKTGKLYIYTTKAKENILVPSGIIEPEEMNTFLMDQEIHMSTSIDIINNKKEEININYYPEQLYEKYQKILSASYFYGANINTYQLDDKLLRKKPTSTKIK